MSQPNNATPRWIGIAALLIACLGVGWFIGMQFGTDDNGDDNASQPERRHADIAGTVIRVDADNNILTVDHEAIEGFMSAMQMDLNVAEPAELENIEPDDEILFDMVRIGRDWYAVRIRPANTQGSSDSNPPADPHALPANAINPGDRIPNLTLIDHEGSVFNLREMTAQHTLITFFYIRCPLTDFCPAQSERLSQLQTQLADSNANLHLLTLTLDAEHDTPELLRSYAQRFDADPTYWTLAASDNPNEIRDLAHRAGARIHQHDEGYEIDHAVVALRVDGDRVVDRVFGLDSIERLITQMAVAGE